MCERKVYKIQYLQNLVGFHLSVNK
uniref:Uncharacterized protein n=1 Tax=Anguilla anguilla TaxID=7936 RepID=A0A0E9TJT4_ANGAN